MRHFRILFSSDGVRRRHHRSPTVAASPAGRDPNRAKRPLGRQAALTLHSPAEVQSFPQRILRGNRPSVLVKPRPAGVPASPDLTVRIFPTPASQCRLFGPSPHFRNTPETSAACRCVQRSPGLENVARLAAIGDFTRRVSNPEFRYQNFLAETWFARAETGSTFLVFAAKQTFALNAPPRARCSLCPTSMGARCAAPTRANLQRAHRSHGGGVHQGFSKEVRRPRVPRISCSSSRTMLASAQAVRLWKIQATLCASIKRSHSHEYATRLLQLRAASAHD